MKVEQQEPAMGVTECLGSYADNPPQETKSGETIFALGQEWTVSQLEQGMKAQFEQWVRRNARMAMRDAQEDGPEEISAMRSCYTADMGAGHYNWDGRHVRSARGDIPGIKYLLFLLIRRAHKNVTEAQIDAMFTECPRDCGMALAWAQLGNSSSPKAKTLTGDTNTHNGNQKKTPTRPTTPTTMDSELD